MEACIMHHSRPVWLRLDFFHCPLLSLSITLTPSKTRGGGALVVTLLDSLSWIPCWKWSKNTRLLSNLLFTCSENLFSVVSVCLLVAVQSGHRSPRQLFLKPPPIISGINPMQFGSARIAVAYLTCLGR
jgi:hypothetical protein